MANKLDQLAETAKLAAEQAARAGIRSMDTQNAISAYNGIAPAADKITKNEAAVINKMGFTTGAELLYFDAERNSRPALKGFFSEFTDDFAQNNAHNPVLAKIGSRIKQEGQQNGFSEDAARNGKTGVLDKIATDLADPATKQAFSRALKEHPAEVGTLFDDYADGKISLKQLSSQAALTVGGSTPAPVAAATAAPEPAAAPAEPKPTKAGKPKSTTHHSGSAHPTEPVAAAAATPSVSADAVVSTSAAVAQAKRDFFSEVSKLSDQEIASSLETRHIVQMADELANTAGTQYGVDNATAHGFHDRISGDPALQQSITENFKRHPEFVRQMAKQMSGQESLPDNMKELARKEMSYLMQNPQKLGDDQYVKGMTSKMHMSGSMNGIASLFQGMGLDTSGMGGFFKGLFENIGRWFKDLFGSFSHGGVHQFLSQPSNQGLGMFEKMGRSVSYAMDKAGSSYHSPYELAAQQPVPRADGSYFHTESRTDKNGNVINREVANTIDLTTVNGTTHKIVPTDGVVPVKMNQDGTVEMRLVTQIKRDADGAVRATDNGDFTVTVAEADRFRQTLEGVTGKQAQFKEFGNDQPQRPNNPAQIEVTYVDRQNGSIGPTTYPLQNQPSSLRGGPITPDLNRNNDPAFMPTGV